ncbi:putative uncharacterized protein DDB_G0282133 [Oppia nitens]|uniref:putative uncharacterized protein DDB_G0282133 n=1 Tax=Oppia nitens TaxID=1686743 RepID=UPI0023DC64ED|nr:putative uncharacterized protein DDB_G0282133 [Oppia nitens]
MSSMSELAQSGQKSTISSDLVDNSAQNNDINDGSSGLKDNVIVSDVLIKPDVVNCSECLTIDCGNNSSLIGPESSIRGTNGMETDMSRVSRVDGMRTTGADSTRNQTPDVCSVSQHTNATDTDGSDGVDCMREDPIKGDLNCHFISSSINTNLQQSDNEVIVIETVVKSDSQEVTLITDTTVKTTIHLENKNFNQSCSELTQEIVTNTNSNNNNTYNNSTNTMSTTTTSRPKQLKSLLKKGISEKSMKGNVNKGHKRVKFSETMQVFCDDWPQNLMPQIIALKSPTDFNLVEVQGYMFEPPVEYQDLLPFEPPPDYRDFIANSLCAFENDLSIDYIDDDMDDDVIKANKSEQKFINEISSKWESMILNNNESLEEEQIIGVLKEDAILQAIGSHISLPDEQLCPEDFPVHFHNTNNETTSKLTENDLSDITSDEGNDESSPTGSLQDLQSDSSITSQDTIILINTDSNGDSNNQFEIFTNKNSFNDLQTTNHDFTNSDNNIKTLHEDILNDSMNSRRTSDSNDLFETNTCVDGVVKSTEDESTRGTTYDNRDKESEDYDVNGDNRKQINKFSDDNCDTRNNHSQTFKRNLMFYENMLSDKSSDKSMDNNSITTKTTDKVIKQTVSHFIIDNNPKYPIITQTVSAGNANSDNCMNNTNNTINTDKHNDMFVENKQMSDEVTNKAMNANDLQINTSSTLTMRAPAAPQQSQQNQLQTQSNTNNWSTDEFIIEYTSEPKALVPSKRTASLSNFMVPHMTGNSLRQSNTNINHNIQYLSLNRNGEISKQWNHTIDAHNKSSLQLPYNLQPNQRSLSPNPTLIANNSRSVSPQPPPYYQSRPQYVYSNPPRGPTSQAIPVQVMYNRIAGQNQQPVMTLPIMSQTLGHLHKQPPPYHYHLQQHNEFPNPSEIRRRDGLNAYPHILNQTPQIGSLPVPPINHNNNNSSSHNLSKDELEQFVQQDIQRTERIKKRYSMSEDEDPSFGFARRPSVRGIRPKFGTTDDILKQIQTKSHNSNGAISSQSIGSHVSWPQMTNNRNICINNTNISNNQMSPNVNQIQQRRPQIIHVRLQPQNAMTVRSHEAPVLGAHGPVGVSQIKAGTLPRPQSLIVQSKVSAINSNEGLVIRVPANTTRDQLKQQIQRQLEQQLQTRMKQKMSSMPMTATKPVMMSSNDERGAPEGASSSPKHSSDVLFAKNLNTNSNTNVVKPLDTTTANNRQQTNDTKKLVINDDNTTNSNVAKDNEGVIYYSMNV